MNQHTNPRDQKPPDSPMVHRQKRNKRINDTIIIALIGAISTILTTVIVSSLGFGPFARFVEQKWFPSPTPTNGVALSTATALPLDVPTPYTSFITVTIEPVSAPVMPTDTLAPPTETPVPPKMMVVVQANKRGGSTPLAVKFNAVDSFLQFVDGRQSKCDQYNCKYTWSIYDPDKKIVGGPIEWRESYSYTFSRPGLYMVKVSICQGDVCGDGSITIGVN
jgi:hypothetical protein